jgi:hypothetical protein
MATAGRRAGHACIRFERVDPARLRGIPRLRAQRCAFITGGPHRDLAHGRGTRTARLVSEADPAFQPMPPEFHQVVTNSGTTGKEQMHKHFVVVMSALLCICARTSPADESARAQMKGLDEQVQEVKSDVLSIAAELNQLEEKLLYPSDTHLAVFVSLAHGETLRLDAVQIQIDGRLATHYIYSFKELDALRKGGVQRIYSGNIGTGAHDIEVSVSAKLANGKDYTQTEHFPFTKEIKPKLLGVLLAGPDAAQPGIHVGDW